MRYHKIRQWVMDDKVIDLVKISTKKNPANMITKTIPMVKFRASRALGKEPCDVTKGERKEGE